MNDLAAFLQRLTWQDVATAASLVFGIVTLIAYWEQRRSARAQAPLIAFAERHVQKDLSEDALNRLAAEKAQMEHELTQRIPVLARQAVLKEQALLHATAAAEHFQRWRHASEELGTEVAGEELPAEVRQAIVDRLVPQHEKQQRLERLRSRVSVLSVALALASTLLPPPVHILVSSALALPLGLSLLQFTALQSDRAEWVTYLRSALHAAYVGLWLYCAVGAGMLFAIGNLSQFGIGLSWALLVLAGLLVLSYWPFRRWLRRQEFHRLFAATTRGTA